MTGSSSPSRSTGTWGVWQVGGDQALTLRRMGCVGSAMRHSVGSSR
jgi:hypothetical protein